MTTEPSNTVALIGLGSIGISFAALHLRYTNATVKVFDTRPDLEQHVQSVLPVYIETDAADMTIDYLRSHGRLQICTSLEEACQDATIVQEQGPENLQFKQSIWAAIENCAPANAHFWSSTSGIAASKQSTSMRDPTRLLVVHPFNPPHIMPLMEIVPSPQTASSSVDFARNFFENLNIGYKPIVIRKEMTGFVGNRLAYALLREAAYLVSEGAITAPELDTLVKASIGPRWALQGPFQSYHMGGGAKGLEGFLSNLSGTIEEVWQDLGTIHFPSTQEVSSDQEAVSWQTQVVSQTHDAFGMPTPEQYRARDSALKKVLQVQREQAGE